MDITYYMLNMPPFVLFILISLLGAILGGLGTFLFRKYIKMKILRSHNEVTGFLFLAIASFYAFLLSFVVFMVWGQLNETRGNVSREGSSAMGLYRDIKYYPDTIESKQLMILYLDFVYNVIDEEFSNTESMQPSRKTTESFNHVFFKMEHLDPKSQFQIQLVAEMFNHLNQLATFRGLRITSMETKIPAPMWFPIILGAIITIFCSMLLDIEHTRMHVSLNALLGIFLAMIFFIILSLNPPYYGNLKIKPESYKQIFTMEKWNSELQPTKSTP
jgi:hypothetical protein